MKKRCFAPILLFVLCAFLPNKVIAMETPQELAYRDLLQNLVDQFGIVHETAGMGVYNAALWDCDGDGQEELVVAWSEVSLVGQDFQFQPIVSIGVYTYENQSVKTLFYEKEYAYPISPATHISGFFMTKTESAGYFTLFGAQDGRHLLGYRHGVFSDVWNTTLSTEEVSMWNDIYAEHRAVWTAEVGDEPLSIPAQSAALEEFQLARLDCAGEEILEEVLFLFDSMEVRKGLVEQNLLAFGVSEKNPYIVPVYEISQPVAQAYLDILRATPLERDETFYGPMVSELYLTFVDIEGDGIPLLLLTYIVEQSYYGGSDWDKGIYFEPYSVDVWGLNQGRPFQPEGNDGSLRFEYIVEVNGQGMLESSRNKGGWMSSGYSEYYSLSRGILSKEHRIDYVTAYFYEDLRDEDANLPDLSRDELRDLGWEVSEGDYGYIIGLLHDGELVLDDAGTLDVTIVTDLLHIAYGGGMNTVDISSYTLASNGIPILEEIANPTVSVPLIEEESTFEEIVTPDDTKTSDVTPEQAEVTPEQAESPVDTQPEEVTEEKESSFKIDVTLVLGLSLLGIGFFFMIKK